MPARRLEVEISNKIRQLGGKESPIQAMRELECAPLPADALLAGVCSGSFPCCVNGKCVLCVLQHARWCQVSTPDV